MNKWLGLSHTASTKKIRTGAMSFLLNSKNTFWVFWDEVQCPGLGSEVLTSTIDPDIHSLGLAGLLDAQTEEPAEKHTQWLFRFYLRNDLCIERKIIIFYVL